MRVQTGTGFLNLEADLHDTVRLEEEETSQEPTSKSDTLLRNVFRSFEDLQLSGEI